MYRRYRQIDSHSGQLDIVSFYFGKHLTRFGCRVAVRCALAQVEDHFFILNVLLKRDYRNGCYHYLYENHQGVFDENSEQKKTFANKTIRKLGFLAIDKRV